MTTIRTGKSTNTYKRYTPVQLASTIRQLQKKCISVSKMPTWKKIGGKTVAQCCNAYASEAHKVANVLRAKTVQQINAKIRTLKSQMANRIGVKVSSPRASSPAVKRLKAKIRQINQCPRISTLCRICTGVKLSTFKNPATGFRTRAKRRTTRSVRYGRRTTARRARKTPATHAKYKRQTKTLRKQVTRLQRRNSFMKRLVNQFRRKVAQLQRSYKGTRARPRWRVVQGRGTSNVVRFRSTSWSKPAQRRVG